MIKVGLTGGIGSGKSTVAKVFESIGIPVYYTDDEAKKLMNRDPIKSLIIKHFGEESFINGKLNRSYISSIVFNNKDKLELLNSLTHQPIILHSLEWCDKQSSPYIIQESALVFESKLSKVLDVIIGVYAPEELKLERVMKRDNMTREDVLKRMASQMNDDKKLILCDYIIINDGKNELLPQVECLHKLLCFKYYG